MRELYMKKMEKDREFLQIPGHVRRIRMSLPQYPGYDQRVKQGIEKIKSDILNFREFAREKSPDDPEIRYRFDMLRGKITAFLQENGCYYPDSLPNEIISFGMENGGHVFSILFDEIREDLRKNIQKNCRMLIL